MSGASEDDDLEKYLTQHVRLLMYEFVLTAFDKEGTVQELRDRVYDSCMVLYDHYAKTKDEPLTDSLSFAREVFHHRGFSDKQIWLMCRRIEMYCYYLTTSRGGLIAELQICSRPLDVLRVVIDGTARDEKWQAMFQMYKVMSGIITNM